MIIVIKLNFIINNVQLEVDLDNAFDGWTMLYFLNLKSMDSSWLSTDFFIKNRAYPTPLFLLRF